MVDANLCNDEAGITRADSSAGDVNDLHVFPWVVGEIVTQGVSLS
jgi:hypothetical protein